MGLLEESIMNAKKSVNAMGKKVMSVVYNFEETNEKNATALNTTKLEFTDLCNF